MLVFMVGSSGVLVLLSGDHARFVPVPQRGQKNPREAGLSLKKGRHPAALPLASSRHTGPQPHPKSARATHRARVQSRFRNFLT
jgi:hypothetical protein